MDPVFLRPAEVESFQSNTVKAPRAVSQQQIFQANIDFLEKY